MEAETTMNEKLKKDFVDKWKKYFKGAELPFVFFYSDDKRYESILMPLKPETERMCMISQLNIVRRGKNLAFTKDTVICQGGLRYSGFRMAMRPNFRYFLSCGIPGKLEGERYKKTPEIVDEAMKEQSDIPSPGNYLVFKRLDKVEIDEVPEAVIFYATPDILAGLFALANFRLAQPLGVIAPFSAGCGSIIGYPLRENRNEQPRAVLGMFDVSARPHVEEGILSFTMPKKKFHEMVEDMDESFLITKSWAQVAKRIAKAAKGRP